MSHHKRNSYYIEQTPSQTLVHFEEQCTRDVRSEIFSENLQKVRVTLVDTFVR